ncbi:MAG: nucleotide exchange factor GrpE, partial [bacterium]
MTSQDAFSSSEKITPEAESLAPESENPVPSESDEHSQLQERLEKAEMDLLRALADRENTIKRMDREKTEAIKFAVSG